MSAVPKHPSLRCLRSFSTTLPTAKPATQSQVPRYTKGPPPYPYGPALHYKQADSGLYGGATIQFGNKVSERNALKSRRAWRLNIHNKRLWSDALGRFVQVKVQARVLRTIDKCGGLDAYLLGDKPGRIKELGVKGWRLRWLVMRTGKVKRRVKGEKEALGLVGQGTAIDEGEAGRADTLEEEVERASGEVVEYIGGAEAGQDEPSELEDEPGYVINSVDSPLSSNPITLETRIILLTLALKAETAHQAQKNTRSTEGERRTWRAAQAMRKLNLDSTSHTAVEGEEEELLGKQVDEVEEAVKAKMEDAKGEGREKLEIAMEKLRRARMELEGVRAEAVDIKGDGEGEERGGSEGGLLGRIKRLFRRG